MSKRLQAYIDALTADHPEDIISNDDLLFLRHGFNRPGAAELRNIADRRVLCQFTHEGIYLRSFNATPISCLPWSLFIGVQQPMHFSNPGITLQLVGNMLHIWKVSCEQKDPLIVPIQH